MIESSNSFLHTAVVKQQIIETEQIKEQSKKTKENQRQKEKNMVHEMVKM